MIRFVYRTINLTNGHDYVGQHTTRKWDDDYLGSGVALNRAINKYGRENFKREILEVCNNKRQLNGAERKWIKELSPYYNIAPGGDGLSTDYWTEEKRKEMSERLSGANNPNFNKPMSEEQKKKISIANTGKTSWIKGKHMSEEYRAKISASQKIAMKGKFKGKENPMYGKKMSKEVLTHLSKVRKGKHWYNNGIISTTAYECPAGFVEGRLL